MVLSDSSILKEIENGNILIEPFNRDNLNPCSVDLTISSKYRIYNRKKVIVGSTKDVPRHVADNPDSFSLKFENSERPLQFSYLKELDVKFANEVEEYEMPEEGLVLMPNQVYLYCCNERIGVNGNIRAKVEGKSSLGRLGLFVHVTAGFIDTGFEGSLVLELVATVPLRIYPNMKICQIEYARVEGEVLEGYDKKAGSKYMNQSGVTESKMHLNFEDK